MAWSVKRRGRSRYLNIVHVSMYCEENDHLTSNGCIDKHHTWGNDHCCVWGTHPTAFHKSLYSLMLSSKRRSTSLVSIFETCPAFQHCSHIFLFSMLLFCFSTISLYLTYKLFCVSVIICPLFAFVEFSVYHKLSVYHSVLLFWFDRHWEFSRNESIKECKKKHHLWPLYGFRFVKLFSVSKMFSL